MQTHRAYDTSTPLNFGKERAAALHRLHHYLQSPVCAEMSEERRDEIMTLFHALVEGLGVSHDDRRG